MFGIINPAHALRRSIIWGGAAIISGGLGLGDPQPITDALKSAGFPAAFADVLHTILSVLMHPSVNYIAAIALALLVVLEIVALVMDRLPRNNATDSVSVRPDAGNGTLWVGPGSRIDFAVSVTNAGDRPLVINGAHLKVIRGNVTPVLYSEHQGPTQITASNPMLLGVNATAAIEIIVRTPPVWLVRLALLFAWRPMIWLVSFPASLTFNGDVALPKAATPLRLSILRRSKTAP